MTHNRYIWQEPDWPCWRFDYRALADLLSQVSLAQGQLLGRLVDLGQVPRSETSLALLAEDVVKSSEIEGEILNAASVRSSLARRLGIDVGALAPLDRHVEGVVEMILDATLHCQKPLSAERLFAWHAALFPTGYSGMNKIAVARWRSDEAGPMQVVSGRIDRPRVHYEALPAAQVAAEMSKLIAWLNAKPQEPLLIRAGLGHLWFVTIRPFDDGNSRIARALGDLLLARADASPQRFYSLSAQIQKNRDTYYEILEQTQKGSLDVTAWLVWFLNTLDEAIAAAHHVVDGVVAKARFWQRHAQVKMNERQIKVINRLLDGFEGKLTSKKWAALTKCSADTALRDINELIACQILRKSEAGGRSTSYELVGG